MAEITIVYCEGGTEEELHRIRTAYMNGRSFISTYIVGERYVSLPLAYSLNRVDPWVIEVLTGFVDTLNESRDRDTIITNMPYNIFLSRGIHDFGRSASYIPDPLEGEDDRLGDVLVYYHPRCVGLTSDQYGEDGEDGEYEEAENIPSQFRGLVARDTVGLAQEWTGVEPRPAIPLPAAPTLSRASVVFGAEFPEPPSEVPPTSEGGSDASGEQASTEGPPRARPTFSYEESLDSDPTYAHDLWSGI